MYIFKNIFFAITVLFIFIMFYINSEAQNGEITIKNKILKYVEYQLCNNTNDKMLVDYKNNNNNIFLLSSDCIITPTLDTLINYQFKDLKFQLYKIHYQSAEFNNGLSMSSTGIIEEVYFVLSDTFSIEYKIDKITLNNILLTLKITNEDVIDFVSEILKYYDNKIIPIKKDDSLIINNVNHNIKKIIFKNGKIHKIINYR